MISGLHDIDGADPASVWPLAIGWWVLIGLMIGFIVLLSYWIWKRSTWQAYALKHLNQLERDLAPTNGRETVIALSEYLRRIVLKRFHRSLCAGLMGEEWLKWLKENDHKGFDWEKKGQLLISMPYAPSSIKLSLDEIKQLITAVKGWVR